jgi:uncharacterized protein (UPF0335 family)
MVNYNSQQTVCTQQSKLWRAINQIEKIKKTKITLTPEQRYNLCNYLNGKPFDKKVLQPFTK